MNLQLFTFFKTYFPSLFLVQFSAMQFQLWDKNGVIWAKIEVEKDSFKIISIQQKSKVADTLTSLRAAPFQVSEGQDVNFLEELNNLSIEFNQNIKPLLENFKIDFEQRKKELKNQFRNGFSVQQKENLAPIFQLLEEGGHSVFLLPEWIAIFEFWQFFCQKSNFEKSFFQKNEILKAFGVFYNNSHKSKIPISYSKIENFVIDFCQKNKIKEREILLYGILNQFLNKNDISRLDFVPILQQKINEDKPKKIWINDNQILKPLEFNNEDFEKKTFFGTYESFADLLLAFFIQNETLQFALASKKIISQVGIFGLSQNSKLVNRLNSESNYDLIILDSDKQSFNSTKEILLFQSLSKKDKQLVCSLQNSFKLLSENGVLFLLLNQNQNQLLDKKALSSFRRLLQEWFERIEIYDNKKELGIFFYKKTKQEKGVFYSEVGQNKSIIFQNNFLPSTWKPKPILSEYQKLIPAISLQEEKNAVFKTHFRAISKQKIERFIESDFKNNLKVKVENYIKKYNQQVEKLEEKTKNKLEKKKIVLASKLATNTLFEKDILEEIETKTIRKRRNNLLEFDEKNLIETQISLFENGFWYYERSVFEELESQHNYDLDKIFPRREQGENILIFWSNTSTGGEIWATDKPVPSNFLNEILPNAYIFPFYIYDNGKQKSNLSDIFLHKFRRGYAAAFEKRIEKIESAIQVLFDLSDFEFLQVNQELAFELRNLSDIVDKDEYKITKELKENLHNPEQNTYIQFEQITKIFKNTKRTFERLENKAVRNKESQKTLQNYFEKGEKAIDFIENYWQKLESEEAQDFVVPTEENMTEKLILGYIFAVWQRDLFKNKYKEELKNDIPRIPIYKDFHYFANQGEFLLQKFLRQNSIKTEFEIVELFEENQNKKMSKSSKIWFEKENKIWFDKTTFLQPVSELDFDKINQFEVNQVSFLEITLKFLSKNKVDLQDGKEILERIISFIVGR